MTEGSPPRIAPLAPKQWPEEMREAIAALRPPAPRHPLPERRDDRPKGLNALGTLARYPALARAFHTFNGHVLFGTTLSERQRELIVLRVAHLRSCAYEWAQHSLLATEAGLTREEVDAVARGSAEPLWSSLERAMLSGVDELVSSARVSDETWEVLANHLDEKQLMDLVFTVGAYDALAMAFLSFQVELDSDLTNDERK